MNKIGIAWRVVLGLSAGAVAAEGASYIADREAPAEGAQHADTSLRQGNPLAILLGRRSRGSSRPAIGLPGGAARRASDPSLAGRVHPNTGEPEQPPSAEVADTDRSSQAKALAGDPMIGGTPLVPNDHGIASQEMPAAEEPEEPDAPSVPVDPSRDRPAR